METVTQESVSSRRQASLATKVEAAGLDAVALNAGPSLTYLTGLHFHLSERPVVGIFTRAYPVILILPELELRKVENLPFPVEVFPYGEDPAVWPESFNAGSVAAKVDGGRVGVEPRRMRVLELRLLEAAAPEAGFVSVEGAMADLRMRKDESEIDAMRRAVHIAQDALDATLPQIRAGTSERELAAAITQGLLSHGSDSEMPFSPIVASGPNSANPHAVPTDRRLENGDTLVIDWGACVEGYFSDLTRTFSIGELDPEMEKIAGIVEAANAAARSAARPGVKASDVDRAARQVIEESGYGEYFTHRTGHGLGLEIHEEPYLYAGNPMELEVGMTFTIEPGIYLPGHGGVRIEDNVVVTPSGADSLSNLQRKLLRIDLL